MASVSSGSKAERFGYIERYGSELGVRYLCDWLCVSRSGYYKWRERSESLRDKSNRQLSRMIEKLYWSHDTNYGSPRIHAALRAKGYRVNHKRVARLMREAGLIGKAGRLYRRKAVPEKFYTKLPNLRIKAPPLTGINQQWVGDLTYLKVGKEWRYLAVVMDVYSRRILGWSVGANKTSELTRASLRKAIRYRNVTPGLIFHTDRGSEYGAYMLQDELKRVGIRPSMNRPRHVTDNAHMESFFQSMKTECIHEIKFKDEQELRVTLSSYLNYYYNKRRLHSSLDYRTPEKYEALGV